MRGVKYCAALSAKPQPCGLPARTHAERGGALCVMCAVLSDWMKEGSVRVGRCFSFTRQQRISLGSGAGETGPTRPVKLGWPGWARQPSLAVVRRRASRKGAPGAPSAAAPFLNPCLPTLARRGRCGGAKAAHAASRLFPSQIWPV